ncbi:MAG: hypothetical protein CL609_18165 [Anaerolineaceae bacterium]|nr:hypothetical protein [Anaerolineaceae bacterium]
MNEASLVGLVNNTALLLAIALLFDLVAGRWKIGQTGLKQIPVGIFIGAVGIALMLTPWEFVPGIIFDTRSILLSISGLFFGLIPTLIAMAMTAAFRIYQGGAATLTGVGVILATGTIGLLWRHRGKIQLLNLSWSQLYLFGLINHVVMLLLMFLLPMQTALQVLRQITLPVILIYPIGTMLLGILMVNHLKREQNNLLLKENEERLRLAVKGARIGFFSRDMKTDQVVLSPEWKTQIGYTDNEIKNDKAEWEKRIHPEDKEKTLQQIEQFYDQRQTGYEMEYRLLHKNGSYIWVLERGFFETNEKGEVTKLLGCNIDITNQKIIEESILSSERRFRSLAESSLDYIMLYDKDNRHVYMNPAALKVSGLTSEEVIGKSHIEAGYDPELSEQWEKDIQKVFLSGEDSQWLFTWESAEGSMDLDWRLSPVFDANGEVELVLGISRDITEIKKTEDALRKSEAKFRQIFETAGIGISLANLKGEFLSGNPAVLTMLGYTLDEYKQLSVKDITYPDDLEKNLAIYEAYLSGSQKSFTIEKRNFKKNGEIVWGQLTSTVVLDGNGKPLFTIGMFEDITKRKQDQMALKHLLATADQSRLALLSVVEDQKFTQDALTKLTKELMVAYDSTLKGWSNALELRERETAGHSKRVVNLTLELAKRLNIPSDHLIHVERGALLHDIGKMGIPDSILSKPGPLTEEEWVVMRLHPTYAYRLLSEIEYLKPALDIPYSHHERWDGSGYPQGLSGENIPLAARIFSVIDVWDALSSDRPYRPAWENREIINYLKTQSGKQFDPQVVEEFLKLIES